MRAIKRRPETCNTKSDFARSIGVHMSTLKRWGDRWPRVKRALDEIVRPLAQDAMSEAAARAREAGTLPYNGFPRPEIVPTAEGLARIRELGALQPALRHIAAELGYSEDTLRAQIDKHDAVNAALELGRADTLKLVTHAQIRKALEGDTRAAELIVKMFAPDLLTQRAEHAHKHEFTFNVPDIPTNPALDARIIDADADDHA